MNPTGHNYDNIIIVKTRFLQKKPKNCGAE